MPLDLDDIIAAIASPPGSCERGIIRMSGVDIVAAVDQVFVADEASNNWQRAKLPQRFTGMLRLPAIGIPLPTALFLWPTSRSYTGQPMAEFHTIGSPPLLDAVLDRLYNHGVRPAERGEFTMRAFLAGRLDLVQAEGVLGVIDAADHEQLKAALTQLGGGITSKLADVRHDILTLLGDLEAGLDFVEEDIEFITKAEIVSRLESGLTILSALSDAAERRLPSGHRRRVVLAGLPNAGKSTLFNRLLGKRSAIVSTVAGTTRDYLSAAWTIGDSDVELIDTAGWELATDPIMQQAQQQRATQLQSSDVVVWCTAADLSADEVSANQDAREQAASTAAQILDVATRWDVLRPDSDARHPGAGGYDGAQDKDGPCGVVPISAMTGEGVDEFLAELRGVLSNDDSTKSELLATTAVRCRDSLNRATAAMQSAIAAARSAAGDEIIAVELRDALHQLGTILGEVYTDDILDHIFSNFCIGK